MCYFYMKYSKANVILAIQFVSLYQTFESFSFPQIVDKFLRTTKGFSWIQIKTFIETYVVFELNNIPTKFKGKLQKLFKILTANEKHFDLSQISN